MGALRGLASTRALLALALLLLAGVVEAKPQTMTCDPGFFADCVPLPTPTAAPTSTSTPVAATPTAAPSPSPASGDTVAGRQNPLAPERRGRSQALTR
jgi:hypothetical protein